MRQMSDQDYAEIIALAEIGRLTIRFCRDWDDADRVSNRFVNADVKRAALIKELRSAVDRCPRELIKKVLLGQR